MEARECIVTRRSIRNYTDQKVTKEELEELVKVASYAPTWKNSQTVRYIGILEEGLKDKIAEECTGSSWNTKNIKGAPALVVMTTLDGTCGYEPDGTFSTSKGTHWQSFDAGIAAQTFCLAAHESGLGTLIMGIYDEEKVMEVLGLPEGESVSALIAIGHAAKEPNAPERKAVEELLTIR